MNPALIGLLRQLPPYNRPFAPGQKEKWLVAFKAILDMDYPEPPSDEERYQALTELERQAHRDEART